MSSYRPGAVQFFTPEARTAHKLIASISEEAALSCRVNNMELDDGDLPWVICRKQSGLTQALFLVCFCKKFGFMPHMDANDADNEKEDQKVWQALYEFERTILVRCNVF